MTSIQNTEIGQIWQANYCYHDFVAEIRWISVIHSYRLMQSTHVHMSTTKNLPSKCCGSRNVNVSANLGVTGCDIGVMP